MSPIEMLLTDAEIDALLREEKPAVDARGLLLAFTKVEAKHGHRRHSRIVVGSSGNRFQLALRQSTTDPYDFSVILTLLARDGSLNLRRHNGTSHAHSNPIEGSRFQGVFHVHQATERYQRRGSDAEHFATPTTEFSDLATALTAMLRGAGFRLPPQMTLETTC